jgi:sugar phosphate isomerase/epimerase
MKFAICHELYENTDWATQCRRIAEAGYTGIEVAPFTIGPDLRAVDSSVFSNMRTEAARHGLEVIGLHWLLAKTTGLYLTSPDQETRRRTSDYLVFLAEICHRLGGSLMVFGSPAQRNLLPGVSREQAVDFACDVFAAAAPKFAELGVTLCLEPLTPKETDFLNTCESAMEIINRLQHPAIMLHQDVKAMLGGEQESIPTLIHRHRDHCRHFHVNDSNLLGPGMGPTDYHPILQALQQSGYAGWVSVEVFDYAPGAQNIAVQSISYMKQVLADLASTETR